jgi:hypothetical protein
MMRWLPVGRKRPFLDAEVEEWQVETWRWLLHRLGPLRSPEEAPIVTPTRRSFPPSDTSGHARAEYIFALVKQHAGMSNWECRLVAQSRRPDAQVGDVAAFQFTGEHAAGTFGLAGNEAVTTYDPAGLDNPIALIATLAHELAHYRLASLAEGPPGGPEVLELATDLTTVYMGIWASACSAPIALQLPAVPGFHVAGLAVVAAGLSRRA